MKPCPPQGRGVFPGTKLAGHSGSLGKARKNAWTLRQPAKNSNGVAAPRTLEEVHQAGKKRSSYPLPPGTNPPLTPPGTRRVRPSCAGAVGLRQILRCQVSSRCSIQHLARGSLQLIDLLQARRACTAAALADTAKRSPSCSACSHSGYSTDPKKRTTRCGQCGNSGPAGDQSFFHNRM